MSDDLKVRERWYSSRMEQQVTVVRWGLFGRPVLVFPSAGGDAEEIERHGLVDACGSLLAEGQIKLYSVDSVAGRAMVAKEGSVEHRMWLLNQFHECVRREVLPALWPTWVVIRWMLLLRAPPSARSTRWRCCAGTPMSSRPRSG